MNSRYSSLGLVAALAVVGCNSVPNIMTVNQTSVSASQTTISQTQTTTVGSPSAAVNGPADSQAVPVRSITLKLERQDIDQVVDGMVKSMLADETVIASIGGSRPVLDFGRIESRLKGQRLDTKMLVETLRTRLFRTRKFRFVDAATSAEDLRFMNAQALNGMTDEAQVVPVGQQSAAKMYLYGSISEVRNGAGNIVDQSYLFTLNLKDLRTGELVWSDERPIRKIQN